MDSLSSVLTQVRSIGITNPEENRDGVLIDSPTNLGDLSSFKLSSYDFGSIDYYAQSPTGYHTLSGHFDVESLTDHLQKHGFATEQDGGDPILLKKELYAGGGPMIIVDENRLLCTMGWDQSEERLRNLMKVFNDEGDIHPDTLGDITSGIEAVLPAEVVSFKQQKLNDEYWDVASGYSFADESVELEWFARGSPTNQTIADDMEATIENIDQTSFPRGMIPKLMFMDIPLESETKIGKQGVVVTLEGECYSGDFFSRIPEIDSSSTSFFGHPLI